MNRYPELGATVWALYKMPEYIAVIPAQVIGVDHSDGKAILRWSRSGVATELKRRPECVWSTKEEAEEARPCAAATLYERN